jgi:hypothetical protein
MAEEKDGIERRAVRSCRNEMSEDEIDHNLMGTLPASDPPSWTLGIERDRIAAADDSERNAPRAALAHRQLPDQ